MKWLAAFALAAGIVMLIRLFCIESYRISTDSMEEALHKGDYILVKDVYKRQWEIVPYLSADEVYSWNRFSGNSPPLAAYLACLLYTSTNGKEIGVFGTRGP